MAKTLPFIGKTWSSHGPSNWFFLNHNLCAQGCSMPNFTTLGVSQHPLFLEMAKIWPFYGQNMVLTWSFKISSSWIIINVPRRAPCQISQYRVYPIVLFQEMAKIWPFMAKTWSSHGPSTLFFLSLNQFAHGCSMPNFRVLASILTDILNFVTQSGSQ